MTDRDAQNMLAELIGIAAHLQRIQEMLYLLDENPREVTRYRCKQRNIALRVAL